MTITTIVTNLSDGSTQTFVGLPANKAVVMAFEQDLDNNNTWTYQDPYNHPKFSVGYWYCFCDNFVAPFPKSYIIPNKYYEFCKPSFIPANRSGSGYPQLKLKSDDMGPGRVEFIELYDLISVPDEFRVHPAIIELISINIEKRFFVVQIKSDKQ